MFIGRGLVRALRRAEAIDGRETVVVEARGHESERSHNNTKREMLAMKWKNVLFASALPACLSAFVASNAETAAPIAPEALSRDIQTLISTMQRTHPEMFAYTTREVFNARKEETLRRIERPMTRLEFYKLVATLIAALKSGHTYVVMPGWDEHLKTDGRFYPLDTYWHGEAVILADYYGPESLPLGGTVLSINGQPAAQLLLRLSCYFPAEGQEGNRFELERPTILQQVLWSEFRTSDMRLEIRDLEGRIHESQIQPITLRQAVKEKMPHHNEGLSSCQYLAEFETALVRIESFGLEQQSNFNRFLARTFADIRARKVASLILDLRDNPGGSSLAVRTLLVYLTDGDILLQESESPLERLFSRPNIDVAPFAGQVFVLIGKRTGSAAMGCAAAIRYYGLGTLVGEETVERMQFFGESRGFTLPHSRLTYVVASNRTVAIGGKGQSGSLRPDHEVKQAPKDTAEGVDTAVRFSLKMIHPQEGGTGPNRMEK